MGLGTGHAAVFSFAGGGTAIVLTARSAQLHNEGGEQIDATHLGTTGSRAYVPPDLSSLDEFEVETLFNTEDDALPLFVEDDLTVTLPKKGAASNNAATYTGKAWIVGVQHPNFETNVMMASAVRIQWKEKPTYQKEAAPPP